MSYNIDEVKEYLMFHPLHLSTDDIITILETRQDCEFLNSLMCRTGWLPAKAHDEFIEVLKNIVEPESNYDRAMELLNDE